MTATQVLELSQQVQRLMAPMIGRLTTELLEPLLQRTFRIMLRQGMFLPIPTALRGQVINVVYISPVAKAQRQTEARSVLETYQAAEVIAKASQDPSIFEGLDHDAALRVIHDASGAPARILKDANAMAAARQQRMQEETAAKQLGALGEGAEIVNKLGSAMNPEMMAAMGGGQQPMAEAA